MNASMHAIASPEVQEMKGLRLVMALLGMLSATACCNPDPSTTLNVTLNNQQTSMWCWAASGQMTMGYFGTAVQHCDEANKQFGRTDCCNSPVPSACVNGGWPEYPKYGFTSSHTSDAALSWTDLQRQIATACSKEPFAFTWHWTGGGGHMMVARGYKTQDGVNYVYRNNPLPVGVGTADWITYDNYVSGSDHTHWDDYFNIAKQ